MTGEQSTPNSHAAMHPNRRHEHGDDANASGLWPDPVVTEVQPAGPFWEAEPEHQDYLMRNPGGYTCHFPRPHWKLPRRASARTA